MSGEWSMDIVTFSFQSEGVQKADGKIPQRKQDRFSLNYLVPNYTPTAQQSVKDSAGRATI